jgi:hypothetical protein
MSKDCKTIFSLRFGAKMKEIKREEHKGNKDAALEKLLAIAKRLHRIINNTQNPEHYHLYKVRIEDKIIELGGEVPEYLRETSS